MISAGAPSTKVNTNRVAELKKYLKPAVCHTYKTLNTPEETRCGDAINKAINDALKKYKLVTNHQKYYFVNMIRRWAVAAVVFNVQSLAMRGKTSDFTVKRQLRAQDVHKMFVLNPTASMKFKIYSPVDKKPHPVSFLESIEQAALIASKIKGADGDEGIYLPPPLGSEADLIIKAFPKGWQRSHLIERMARLYLTTIKELETNKGDIKKIDHDKVAKEVVQQVRKLAWKAINNKTIPTTLKVNDTVAEAQYKTIANDATGKSMERFLWDMTTTFVLKAEQKNVGTPPKLTVHISFRNAPIKAAIDRGMTHKLRRVSKNTAIGKRFRLMEKIKQADIIREQTVKALKRFYPNLAGLKRASVKYHENRDALDGVMIRKMVVATIKGMRKTFENHYNKDKAQDMALHELEAIGVVLKAGAAKNPDYVVFKLSALNSTGGVPGWIIPAIAKGDSMRAAVAIRRYQQAKKMMGDAAKDPEKLLKMGKTLVKKLKDQPTDKLLLSVVAKVKPDGEVVIKYLPRTLLRHVKSNRVKSVGAEMGAKADPRHPELGVVDIADQIKRLFGELVEIAGDKLKGADADKKKEALLDALVDKLLKLVKDEDTFALKKKTGVSVIFNKTEIIVKDADGKPILDNNGNAVKRDGYTAIITLNDLEGKGGGEIGKGYFRKKKFSNGLVLGVKGDVMSIFLRNLSGGSSEKNNGGAIINIGVEAKYKKFTAGVSLGVAGLKFEPQNASYDEKKPIVHAPFSPIGGFMDVGGLVSVMAGYGFTKNISLNGSAGIIDSKPSGFSSRPFSLDMHTGSLPYLVPIGLGGGGDLSFAYDRFSAAVYAKGVRPLIPSFKASSAWSDGSQITMGAYGRLHINKNFAISAAASYGKQWGGKKEGADGALKLTPLSQVSVMAGAHVNLLNKRLLLDLAYRGVFQNADQETGLQSGAEHTVAFSTMLLFAKYFALFGSASYTRRSDKIKWYEQNGNSLTPKVNTGEIVKEGFGWTLGLGWYTSANTWLALGYTGGRIANRNIEGIKPLHSIFAMFGWVFGEHKAYEKGN